MFVRVSLILCLLIYYAQPLEVHHGAGDAASEGGEDHHREEQHDDGVDLTEEIGTSRPQLEPQIT